MFNRCYRQVIYLCKNLVFVYRTATIEAIYRLPTQVICDVALGGPKLNKLFVTSSKVAINLFTGQPSNDKLTSSAGSLFIIDVGTPGFKASKVRLE